MLTIATDRPDALYGIGETVTFILKVQVDGNPVERGEIN